MVKNVQKLWNVEQWHICLLTSDIQTEFAVYKYLPTYLIYTWLNTQAKIDADGGYKDKKYILRKQARKVNVWF